MRRPWWMATILCLHVGAAHADSCSYADQARQKAAETKAFESDFLARPDCSKVSTMIGLIEQTNQAIDQAVQNCRGYTETKGSGAISDVRASLEALCKAAERAEAARQPPAPSASSASSCGSDITGLGGSAAPTMPCTPSPQAVSRYRAQGQAALQTARARQTSEPSVDGWTAAAAGFRAAAAAFRAARDITREQEANQQAEILDQAVQRAKLAAEPATASPSQRVADVPAPQLSKSDRSRLCAEAFAKSLRCHDQAVRLHSISDQATTTPGSSGQAGAFDDCVNVYCVAMAKFDCSKPIYCGRPPGEGVRCAVGEHLFFPATGASPICQTNAPGSPDAAAAPSNSTITGK